MADERKKTPGIETLAVHAGAAPDPHTGARQTPIYQTTSFVFDDADHAASLFNLQLPGFIYSRYANPTTDMFEKRMCALEGAEDARATASGMAAVAAAILCQVKAGDHVLAARALFGSCRYIIETLLPKYGVEYTLIDGSKVGNWEKAIRPNTRALFLESPTNPTLEVVDIRKVADIANSVGAKLIVDNVFATPLFQKPLELGAHIVVYSATKHIDGQGRCLGGAVLGSEKFINDNIYTLIRQTGPSARPWRGHSNRDVHGV